uniref:Uncharacterized protein n=1 Tax=Vespula pensylvanica TaxID=30213 RepID=A0A834NYD2_VESPE|nr:hypothetical protein H0235_009225 [Vespula pensylvanica]
MNTRKIEHAFSSEIKIFPVPLRTRNGESDRLKDFTDDSGTREKEKENEEAIGIVSRRARVVDGNCELMISEKGRASTAWRCCYYWNETDGRKTEWRERERRRVVCRTSAGLVSAAAGGQTGCPDSTEGRRENASPEQQRRLGPSDRPSQFDESVGNRTRARFLIAHRRCIARNTNLLFDGRSETRFPRSGSTVALEGPGSDRQNQIPPIKASGEGETGVGGGRRLGGGGGGGGGGRGGGDGGGGGWEGRRRRRRDNEMNEDRRLLAECLRVYFYDDILPRTCRIVEGNSNGSEDNDDDNDDDDDDDDNDDDDDDDSKDDDGDDEGCDDDDNDDDDDDDENGDEGDHHHRGTSQVVDARKVPALGVEKSVGRLLAAMIKIILDSIAATRTQTTIPKSLSIVLPPASRRERFADAFNGAIKPY